LKMASAGLNAPITSSAGRLFDAAAALAGMRDKVSYEGQAAIELEQIADPSIESAYPCPFKDGEIDGIELMAHLAADLANGRPVPEAAAAFHNGLAGALVAAAIQAAAEEGLSTIALSGGTFQNQLLAERVSRGLGGAGLEVLVHNRVPANDGGISLGQAAVANARLGTN
jgi:hydrogenase maturation protein HypF